MLDCLKDFNKHYEIYKSTDHAYIRLRPVVDFIRELKLKYWVLSDDLKDQSDLFAEQGSDSEASYLRERLPRVSQPSPWIDYGSVAPVQRIAEFKQHGDLFMALKAQENLVSELAMLSSPSQVMLDAIFTFATMSQTLQGRQIETMSALGLVTPTQIESPVLHRLSRINNEFVILAALQAGLPLNGLDYLGRTALHIAAEMNYPKTASALIQNGIDIECVDVFKRPALSVALQNNSYATANVLLQHDVDVEAGDIYGHTPLHQAIIYM